MCAAAEGAAIALGQAAKELQASMKAAEGAPLASRVATCAWGLAIHDAIAELGNGEGGDYSTTRGNGKRDQHRPWAVLGGPTLGGHPKPAINGHLKTGHYG
jgi:hypothetical protein